MTILVPWMALLEGLPVIAEDLLEGVFVNSLPCGGHSAWLYHVLAAEASGSSPSSTPLYPRTSSVGLGRRGDFEKGNSGFDHGVGHSHLLLDDAKAPHCQKSKGFKGLGPYPSNTFGCVPPFTHSALKRAVLLMMPTVRRQLHMDQRGSNMHISGIKSAR